MSTTIVPKTLEEKKPDVLEGIRQCREAFGQLTEELDGRMADLLDEHKEEFKSIVITHEQLVHETQLYATDLITYMEETIELAEVHGLDAVVNKFTDDIDSVRLNQLIDTCHKLTCKCRVLVTGIQNCNEYRKNTKMKFVCAIGGAVALVACGVGLLVCCVPGVGPVAGAGLILLCKSLAGLAAHKVGFTIGATLITVGVTGGMTAICVWKQVSDKMQHIEDVLEDTKLRQNEVTTIKGKLLEIKGKNRCHYGKSQLIEDANIVIQNCKALRHVPPTSLSRLR